MPRISSITTLAVALIRAAKRKLTDQFTRTTSGSLGLFWQNIRGTWYANGSSAQSDDSANNNSIAATQLSGTDMTVSASVTSGTGVTFWLTDSGNWWASTSNNSASPYFYQCNPWTCFCGSYSCNCYAGYSTSSGGCTSPSYIGSCSQGCEVQCAPYGGYVTSCNASIGTCYDTCTGYSYFYYLTLKNSVAGTVSSVVSDVSLSQQPAAIKVTTFGNQITAQAYSDTNLTSPLGSAISVTPSSPNKGTFAGIIKTTTSYNQQSTVDNFSAEG